MTSSSVQLIKGTAQNIPTYGKHVGAFPEELPRRCIRLATKEGDTVLDPFCGSGTTGKVCSELNRNFIGIDLEYQDLARERIGIKDLKIDAGF